MYTSNNNFRLKYIFNVSDINYFHCKEIVDLLKETTDGSRNLFGRYSSQRMKVHIQYVHYVC